MNRDDAIQEALRYIEHARENVGLRNFETADMQINVALVYSNIAIALKDDSIEIVQEELPPVFFDENDKAVIAAHEEPEEN